MWVVGQCLFFKLKVAFFSSISVKEQNKQTRNILTASLMQSEEQSRGSKTLRQRGSTFPGQFA